MRRVPTTTDAILTPGLLGPAVALALGLFLAVACLQGEAHTAVAYDLDPSGDRTDGAPIACRRDSSPEGEALRQDHASPRRVTSRLREPGDLLCPVTSSVGNEFHVRTSRLLGLPPRPPHPALHVLFCTWLA